MTVTSNVSIYTEKLVGATNKDFYNEDGGSKLLRNAGDHIPDERALR